ncbi:hypothetical protein [Antarcticimicrobium sediminis]|uniref:hypothetical protein n=1 Tax=Antarcticimicrobium sediminis TaxID=2546227 RepID=UPI001404300C
MAMREVRLVLWKTLMTAPTAAFCVASTPEITLGDMAIDNFMWLDRHCRGVETDPAAEVLSAIERLLY